MANFGILFLCFLAGILFGWTSKFPKETPAVLNQFIKYAVKLARSGAIYKASAR